MWDQVKAEAIRQGLNLYLRGRYGEVTSVEWNGRAKSLRIEVVLLGEAEPVEVLVERYEVHVGEDGRTGVVMTGVRVSRAWMQELARTQVEARRLRVPEPLAGVVRRLLG
jgi:hypothetical protein